MFEYLKVFGVRQIILRGQLIEIKESFIARVPYFETLFSERFPTTKNSDGVIISDALNPEIIKVIVQGAQTNRFDYIMLMLPKKESLAELFETLQFLCIPFINLSALDKMKKNKCYSIQIFAIKMFQTFRNKRNKNQSEAIRKFYIITM